MRRTMNISNSTMNKISKSKIDWNKVLGALEEARGIFDNLEFKASEVGLKGAQVSALQNYGIIKVIRTEEVWFKIDEDTMKKGSVNVYVFDTDVSELMAEIKSHKIKELYKRIEAHEQAIAELRARIAQM